MDQNKHRNLDEKQGLIGLAVIILIAIVLGMTIAFFITGGSNYFIKNSAEASSQTSSTEQVSSVVFECNTCGKRLYQNELQDHMGQHSENGVSASYRAITNERQN